MAIHLTGEEFEITRDLFKGLDTDGDGKITVVEFKEQIIRAKNLDGRGCRGVLWDKGGVAEDYINFLMRVYDMDDSGSLEFPEFLQIHAFVTYAVNPTTEYIKHVFRALDKDGKGFISVDDIKRFCRIFKAVDGVPYDEMKADELIKKLDLNGDGKIKYSEFLINYYQFKKFEDDE
jgi:Ca2+-binding EF-hand superfamily protein